MSITIRRILYSFAIIIFFVLTPIIILYTAGYRFDVYKKYFVRTGSIVLQAQPANADLYVNGSFLGTSEQRINHLTPNIYTISIQADGYTQWKKDLEVLPQQTTFATEIQLWPENPKQTTLAAVDIAVPLTTNNTGELLLWQNDTEIKLYSIDTQKTVSILSLPTSEPVTFTWNQNNKVLLITQTNAYWLIPFNEGTAGTPIALHTRLQNITGVNFHTQYPEEAYIIASGQLFTYSINNDRLTASATRGIQEAFWYNGRQYTISKGTEHILTYTESTSENTAPAYQLPISNEYTLFNVVYNHALIHDTLNETVYVLTLDPALFNHTSQIIKQVQGVAIDPNNTRLLLYNDWEVWTIDLTTKQSTTLYRSSQQIRSAAWHPHTPYILVQTANEIRMIELDNRGQRNYAVLLHAENIEYANLSTDGTTLTTVTSSSDSPYPIATQYIIYTPKNLLPF